MHGGGDGKIKARQTGKFKADEIDCPGAVKAKVGRQVAGKSKKST